MRNSSFKSSWVAALAATFVALFLVVGRKKEAQHADAKDAVEVEGYVRGFSRRRPDVEISMLRFANIIGPVIRTSLTDYFALPVVPVPFGYDARLQFVHESDAVGALLRATTGPATGITNIVMSAAGMPCPTASATKNATCFSSRRATS